MEQPVYQGGVVWAFRPQAYLAYPSSYLLSEFLVAKASVTRTVFWTTFESSSPDRGAGGERETETNDFVLRGNSWILSAMALPCQCCQCSPSLSQILGSDFCQMLLVDYIFGGNFSTENGGKS